MTSCNLNDAMFIDAAFKWSGGSGSKYESEQRFTMLHTIIPPRGPYQLKMLTGRRRGEKVARCAHRSVRNGEGAGAEGAEMVAPLAATLAVNEDCRSECKLRTCRALCSSLAIIMTIAQGIFVEASAAT
jgi:hypothetical protein